MRGEGRRVKWERERKKGEYIRHGHMWYNEIEFEG